MEVAFGLKAHSGWAALVALGAHDGVLEVVDRRRLELVEKRAGEWPGQPYHQAEGLTPARAKAVVKSGIDAGSPNASSGEPCGAPRIRVIA